MTQIEQIDDYIEHQLIIQAKAKEIERLTLKKDWNGAFSANRELQEASAALEMWFFNRCRS